MVLIGDSRKVGKGEVTVCCWHDKRDVFVVWTNNSGEDTQKRRAKFQPDDTISDPNVIMDYNRSGWSGSQWIR